MSAETPTLGELAAQLEALQRAQTRRERGIDSIPTVGDFKRACAEKDLRKFLERRERARRKSEARAKALASTRGERERLESTLRGIENDRAARLEQHNCARAKIVEQFADRERETREALVVLAEQVEMEVVEASRGPVEIEVPTTSQRLGADRIATLPPTLGVPRYGFRR